MFATLQVCEKDDVYQLNAGGAFNYQDAGTACSPSGSYSSNWSYVGTTFTLDGEILVIECFNCTTLVASYADFFVAGDKLTITFVKQ